MLCFDLKKAQKHHFDGPNLVATDGNKKIYYCEDSEYPLQKPPQNLWSLVDEEWFLKSVIKKYLQQVMKERLYEREGCLIIWCIKNLFRRF